MQIPSAAEKKILQVEVGDPIICVLNSAHELICWTNITLIGRYVNLKNIAKNVDTFNMTKYSVYIKLTDGRYTSINLFKNNYLDKLNTNNY